MACCADAAALAGGWTPDGRVALAACCAIEPALAPVGAMPGVVDRVLAAAVACAAFDAAPATPVTTAPTPTPTTGAAIGRCSPAERRPTCNAPLSRVASPALAAAPIEPAAAVSAPAIAPDAAPLFRLIEPAAAEPAAAIAPVAAAPRGVDSRSHPAGATGSEGIHPALSAFDRGLVCTGTGRGGIACPVRNTGSAWVV